MTVPPVAGRRSTAEQRRVLALAAASTVLVLVTFVTPLATGVRTAAALGSGLGAQAWALSAMSVGLAATLLTAGVLADDLGRRRVFVAGLGVLAAGFLLTAVGWLVLRGVRRSGLARAGMRDDEHRSPGA